MTTQDRVVALVAKTLSLHPSKVALDIGLSRHPLWDSLAHIEILAAIEDELGVVFSDSEVVEATSIERLLAIVRRMERRGQSEQEDEMPVEETAVSFASYDGTELEGTLLRPVSTPKGACVLVHGITADRHEWGTFDQISSLLAQRGIASVRFDYRCHGAAAGVPDRDLTLAGVQADLTAAHAALRNRIGSDVPLLLCGASFGGGLAARWAASAATPRVSLLVLLYPVLDYAADLNRVNASWRDEIRQHGVLAYGPKRLGRPYACEVVDAQMFGLLDRAADRTVIIHGADDSDVPVHESSQAVEQSKNAVLYEIPGCGHGFAAENDPDLETDASRRNVRKVLELIERELAKSGL